MDPAEQESPSASPERRLTSELVVAASGISIIAFLAHFVFFPLFGLYEDDYILTLPTMSWSWHDLTHWLSDAWIHPIVARPLNEFLRWIICYFTVHGGHLAAGFLLSWVLVSANAILLFVLIRRILPCTAAYVGSLIFVLFPLDTSRQILMIQTDLLVAIFLLLVCFHLYLSGRYWAAYLLVTISLLNLESFFPPFLAAPVLAVGLKGASSWRNFFKKLITHTVILAVLFGLFILGRLTLGEERAREVSLKATGTIGRMIRLAVEGPWHGIEALTLRPIDGVMHCDARLLPYSLFTIAVTAWVLSRCGRCDNNKTGIGSNSASTARVERRKGLCVFIGGLLVWSLSYVLWVPDDYYPPVIGIGRMSGEHAGAAIGAGLAAAGLAVWILSISFIPKRVLALVFSCYCGALVAFGIHIQLSEYVAYWEETKKFWSTLLDQIRDVQDADVILVEQSSDNRVMPVTQGFSIWSQEGYFPFALSSFVDFPKSWKQVPRVYGLWPEVGFRQEGDAVKLQTPSFAPTLGPTIRSGNFIYLQAVDGRLERVDHPVGIAGKMFEPKPRPAENLRPLKLSKLYLNLTSEPTSKDWFTLRDAKSYP
jgi:hypothetical protein